MYIQYCTRKGIEDDTGDVFIERYFKEIRQVSKEDLSEVCDILNTLQVDTILTTSDSIKVEKIFGKDCIIYADLLYACISASFGPDCGNLVLDISESLITVANERARIVYDKLYPGNRDAVYAHGGNPIKDVISAIMDDTPPDKFIGYERPIGSISEIYKDTDGKLDKFYPLFDGTMDKIVNMLSECYNVPVSSTSMSGNHLDAIKDVISMVYREIESYKSIMLTSDILDKFCQSATKLRQLYVLRDIMIVSSILVTLDTDLAVYDTRETTAIYERRCDERIEIVSDYFTNVLGCTITTETDDNSKITIHKKLY